MLGIVLLVTVCPPLISQIPEWQTDWNQRLDEFWDRVEIPSNTDINHAGLAELQEIGFETSQAECLIGHIATYGHIKHLSELQQCGIPLLQIQQLRSQILPFYSDRFRDYKNQTPDSNRWVPKLQLKSNTITNHSSKSWGQTHQFQALWGNWSRLSILTHTDAGETFNDHFTAALEIKSVGRFEHLILGKYQWHWNQGLLFMAPYAIGSSYNLSSWVHHQQQLRNSVSQNEDIGLFGIASTILMNKGKLHVSIGSDKIDTRLTPQGFTSRYYGGNHITDLEKSRRHNNQLSHLFVGWSIAKSTFSFNISHIEYLYKIPKVTKNGILFRERFSEMQYSSQNFLGARSIFNISTNGLQSYSYYISCLWTLSNYLDIAVRSQDLASNNYPPEQSPFTLSDIGKQNHELGIDIVPNEKHRLQIRSLVQFNTDTLQTEYLATSPSRSYWHLQHIYQLNKTEFIAFRFHVPQQVTEIPQWKVQIQAKLHLHTNLKWSTNYITQVHNHTKSTLLLTTLKWNYRKTWNIQGYGGVFSGNDLLYAPLPSAQFPWRLGIFSGSGSTFGIIANVKISKHVKWRFSIEQMQKRNDLNQIEHQKPRIFVQLEII